MRARHRARRQEDETRRRMTAMKHRSHAVLTAGLSALMALALAGPVQAQASRQRDKNNMRNLGIVLGAVAIQQATKGNTTEAVVLGAGAAYAGKKYEDARKAQSQDSDWRSGPFDDGRRRLGDRGYNDDRYN